MEQLAEPQVWGLPCACCRAQIDQHSTPQITQDIAVPPPPPRFEQTCKESAEGQTLVEANGADVGTTNDKKPCRHFARTGNCLYADSCRFAHEKSAATGGEQSSRRTWGGKRRVVRKCGKASAFRRFLLETFGQDLLASGEGVLDVAGGNGELGFLLVNLNGVRTTVIDPRPLRVDRFVRKLRWGVYHGTQPLQSFNTEDLAVDGSARMPGHLRAFLDSAFIDPPIADDMQGFEQALDSTSARAAKVDWTTKGIESRGEDDEYIVDDVVLENSEQQDLYSVPPVEDVLRLLHGASCVVGLHPDQATGAALDLAIALGKPAALVPCCVYAVEFPTRRLPCGRPVRHPADMVEWLLAKDPRVRETTLPFEGRNRVVYFDPNA